MSQYAYLCECRREACRERIVMPVHLHRELEQLGNFVTEACARRDGNEVLCDFDGFMLVATSRAARLATRGRQHRPGVLESASP